MEINLVDSDYMKLTVCISYIVVDWIAGNILHAHSSVLMHSFLRTGLV